MIIIIFNNRLKICIFVLVLLFSIGLILPGNIAKAQSKVSRDEILKKLDTERVFKYKDNKQYKLYENFLGINMIGLMDKDGKDVFYDLDGNGHQDLSVNFKVNKDHAREVWVDKDEDGKYETFYLDNDENGTLETKMNIKNKIYKEIEDKRKFHYYRYKKYTIEENPYESKLEVLRNGLYRSDDELEWFQVDYDIDGDSNVDIIAGFKITKFIFDNDNNLNEYKFSNYARMVYVIDYDEWKEARYFDNNNDEFLETKKDLETDDYSPDTYNFWDFGDDFQF